MTITHNASTEMSPTTPELAMAIVSELAGIRQMAVAELEAEHVGGDLEMASPEAVAVIAALERQFGLHLARLEDLEPEQLTSVASLAGLLHRRFHSAEPMRTAEGC